MLAVVGLGNPGPGYAGNRHNAGFRVVSAFRRRYRLPGFEPGRSCEISRGRFRGRPVVLVKPQSYMNRSGDVVRALVSAERLSPDELLVIADDVYLPLGRLRLKAGGGDGGHNGLGSVIEALDSREFPRLRFGVGAASAEGRDLADFVLDDFTAAENEDVERAVARAVEAVATFLHEGIGTAMNRFNVASESASDGGRPSQRQPTPPATARNGEHDAPP